MGVAQFSVISTSLLVFLAFGCGGGGGDRADAGPTGPCPGTFSMPWTSATDAEFCFLPWDSSKPPALLTECGEVFERCSDSGTTPDLSCLDTPTGTPPATPATVTMRGFVDVFSSGPNADKARVEVYRESDLVGVSDLSAATPMSSVEIALNQTSLANARACPKEKDFMQGQCVIPTNDCAGQCDKDLGAGQFCFNTECVDLQRWEVEIEIPDLPTNEFLAVRTVGIDGSGNPQVLGNTWAQMVQYNVFLATNDDECADRLDRDCIVTNQTPPLYQGDVNLLSAQDYMTIPTTAGLSAGISPGNGAFAGEVHDCNGTRIRGAQVGFTPGRNPRVLVFFNGNPVSTLPRLQQSSRGTNTLGLFSGLDLAPGDIQLGAVGVADSAVREIGRFKTRIWPDTVTLIRIGGGKPPQP